MAEGFIRAQRVDVEQWPECGVEALGALVGPGRLLMAKDGTPYVIASSGHPTRLFDGWFAVRYSNGTIGVVAGDILRRWLLEDEQQQQ